MSKVINIWEKEFEVEEHNHWELGDGIEFRHTQMYNAPDLTFDMMEEISKYFGTKAIMFDNNIAWSGCETCDYGSEYGYTIGVYRITRNHPFK